MKNRFFTIIAFLGLTALFFSSCSKVPQAEIDAANTAIEQAKLAGADVYVQDNFVALQDSLNNVMVSIESQKSKFIKNFSTAKEHLAGVTQYAGEVKQQAETRKEELKVEIQNTISEVKTLIETNRQLILEAPKGKEGTSALVAIKGEIDAVETSINETSTLFESGDYLATLDKAKAAKEKATAINTELSGVIAKYKTNVKNKKA
ncbi:MAG: hypothetical protein JXA77_18505 [Bacteroidales bacterium]|nr:hypothetical protein [Bacteroidales bacterium]MBN2818178.1 hypothetical protein [Bacteroidales bacterium]